MQLVGEAPIADITHVLAQAPVLLKAGVNFSPSPRLLSLFLFQQLELESGNIFGILASSIFHSLLLSSLIIRVSSGLNFLIGQTQYPDSKLILNVSSLSCSSHSFSSTRQLEIFKQ